MQTITLIILVVVAVYLLYWVVKLEVMKKGGGR